MIKSPVCEMLGIKYPIFCGAMAYVTDAALAAAVSDAGGFGVMASIGHTAESLRQEIRKAKDLTGKPFGVNLMLMSPNVAEVVKVVVEEKVAGVTTGAGNPLPYMPALKEAGVKVFPVIPNVKLARRMEENGADGIVAEGMEAGGHIGEMTTLPLLPQVADAVKIPILAAGGIADGRGMAAALLLGACGIQMGTRFMVAKECRIHPNAKQRIIDAIDTDTVHIGRTTGHPMRALKSETTLAVAELEKRAAAKEEIEALQKGRFQAAVDEGDVRTGQLPAGQISGLIRSELTAKEIIDSIIREAETLLRQAPELLRS